MKDDKLVEVLKRLSEKSYDTYSNRSYDAHEVLNKNGLNCSDKHIFEEAFEYGLDDLKKLKEDLIKKGYNHQDMSFILSIVLQMNNLHCMREDDHVNVHLKTNR